MIRVNLAAEGVWVEDRLFGGRLLPRLLAAMLQARNEGLSSCRRVDLRDRIGGLSELHRTQVWRAWRQLEGSPLEGLVCHEGVSSGPFWFEPRMLSVCSFQIGGSAVDDHRLASFLARERTLGVDAVNDRDASPAPLAFEYVEALARADFLFERGQLYPARAALQEAAAHAAADDVLALVGLSIRRARIARRMGDWASLQDELRDIAGVINHARLPVHTRLQMTARLHILSAWHVFGSLGNAASALYRLDEVDPGILSADAVLRSEYSNLRGIVLRDLALAGGDAELAAQAVTELGESIRHAASAGIPDGLQIGAANLANSLSQLLEAGLLGPHGGADAQAALRWLLLSESICQRWQIGLSSLLNAVFLLRLAVANQLCHAQVRAMAHEHSPLADSTSFADYAARSWAACVAFHSQIPVEQRCALLLMWAHHAGVENDRVTACDLCRQILLLSRKLRDDSARDRYAKAVDEVRTSLSGLRAS